LKLLSNDQLHQHFKYACIDRATSQFSDELITQQYEDIYYRVVSNLSKTEFVI
jgi:hypothetical protein